MIVKFTSSTIFIVYYRYREDLSLFLLPSCMSKNIIGRDFVCKRVITAETRMMRCNIDKCLVGILYVGHENHTPSRGIEISSNFSNRADDSLPISMLGSSINFQLSVWMHSNDRWVCHIGGFPINTLL